MGLIVKRWTLQAPMGNEIPWIATVFVTRDGGSMYRVGVGITPEAAVEDLANKTAFWCGVLLVDWHGFLRRQILPDGASDIRLPAELEDHSDRPF